jgi:hypothetical protein
MTDTPNQTLLRGARTAAIFTPWENGQPAVWCSPSAIDWASHTGGAAIDGEPLHGESSTKARLTLFSAFHRYLDVIGCGYVNAPGNDLQDDRALNATLGDDFDGLLTWSAPRCARFMHNVTGQPEDVCLAWLEGPPAPDLTGRNPFVSGEPEEVVAAILHLMTQCDWRGNSWSEIGAAAVRNAHAKNAR